MFTLKAPVVEQLVDLRMGLFAKWRLINPEGMSRHDMHQEFLDRMFKLRRELWQKSLAWLKADLERRESDHKLLAFG